MENDSGDGSGEMVTRDFPGTTLLTMNSNLGFAAGCNRGAAAARGSILLFLNPDTCALPGAVRQLAETLDRNPGAAAAGGLLTDEHGRAQQRYRPQPLPGPGNLAGNLLMGAHRHRNAQSHPGTRSVGQIAGACLMVRRHVFDELGGFDESFSPVFFEDVDLCQRLATAGHVILHVPSARFTHAGGASVRRMRAADHYLAWFGNLLRYGRKHHGRAAGLMLRALIIPAAALRLLATLAPGGAGPFGRGPRASAVLKVASRSLIGWPRASQSTS